jgi:hypothetical protein
MKTTKSNELARFAPPFIGRAKEIEEIRRLHRQGKHTLILGPKGVGKSALIQHLRDELDLLVCHDSDRLGSICESLEGELGLNAADLKLPQRKGQLLRKLPESTRTIVFDNIGWTTPKLSSFLEMAMERVPIWICARSEHSWDIGHFWVLLVRFQKINLQLFHRTETHEFVDAVVRMGTVPADTLKIADWLHHRSDGNPAILSEFVEELRRNSYDLNSTHALRRLDLDRRISETFSQSKILETKANNE